MKKIIIGLLVFGTVFVTASSVNAQTCSYNGYLYSGTQCGVSYQNTYTYTPTMPVYTNNQQNITSYITRLEALLAQLRTLQNQTYTPYTPTVTYPVVYQNNNAANNGRSDVDVETRSATNIDDDRARLRARIDFNREDEATVYFQWGENRNRLNESTIPLVVDEDDNDEDFTQTISRLDEDETYYFRAVAEDENGDRSFGRILSFRTDDDNRSSRNDKEPDVETGDANDIRDDSAEIEGEVDMNDFDNGIVFFVYGEDEDQIDDIERDYDEYRDIDEDGDNLQKVLVDNNVDGSVDVYADIKGLDDDTDIFYALCVEFEDEDDDETIICGSTEEFTTDRD